MLDHTKLRCRTESVRTRALQTAIQTEDDFLEYARAFHQAEEPTHTPLVTNLGGQTIKEETSSGLVGIALSVIIRKLHMCYSQSGMEQLENLVKLMEELSELRDQNCKLKRKVQVLEDLKQGRQQQPLPPPPRPDVQKDRFKTRTNYSRRWEVIDHSRWFLTSRSIYPNPIMTFCVSHQVSLDRLEHRLHRLVDGLSRDCHQELDRDRHQQRKQLVHAEVRGCEVGPHSGRIICQERRYLSPVTTSAAHWCGASPNPAAFSADRELHRRPPTQIPENRKA